MMPVRLRGHHFLCILTYRGVGYTPAFVDNMTAIVEAIDAGRTVVLAEGPDDICGALSTDDRQACNHDCGCPETRALDAEAVAQVSSLLGRDLDGPLVLTASMIAALREAFAGGTIRAACRDCRWGEFCTRIAEEAFAGTRLAPPDMPAP